ncbi:MAG TPA: hypothetical protein VHL11_11520, partial [Phototrophicaceae bacterium]|nr:hypothetical protein [Phototrophicaceae bacterium]
MKVQANPLFRTLIGLMIVISLFTFVIPAPAHAQSELTPYLPVDGQITSVGIPQTWTFSGLEGEVISLYARSSGDGLDPALSLTSSADILISQNDDIAYPGATDALLQAVTLPRTDAYTVTVSGYKETTGGYSLTLLHGYPEIALAETFDNEGSGGADNWTISQPDLILDQVAGKLALSLSGIKASGYVTANDDKNGSTLTDFYADAMISDAEGQGGWIGGLVLRQQNDRYYALVINEAGQWRFTLNSASGEKVLRDWTNHPAIQAGQTSFRLGVLANGNGFDVFYNSLYVGQALDPDLTLAEGKIGFYVETAN